MKKTITKKRGRGGKRHSDAKRKKAIVLLFDKLMKPKLVAKEVRVPLSAVVYWYNTEQARRQGGDVGLTELPRPNVHVSDAITFLRHARNKILGNGVKLARKDLYTLLALDSLEGA